MKARQNKIYSPSPNTPQLAKGMPGLRSRSGCFGGVGKVGSALRSLGQGGSGFGTPPKGSGRRVGEFRMIPRSFLPS